MNADLESVTCPGCESTRPRLSAIVSAGPWERLFYTCPDCGLGFAAGWSSTQERHVPGDTERLGYSAGPPQLAA
jgi:hypothetical protein